MLIRDKTVVSLKISGKYLPALSVPEPIKAKCNYLLIYDLIKYVKFVEIIMIKFNNIW